MQMKDPELSRLPPNRFRSQNLSISHLSQSRPSCSLTIARSIFRSLNRSQHYPRSAQIYGFKRESSKNLTFGGDDGGGEA